MSALEAADLLRETGWLRPADSEADGSRDGSGPKPISIWRPEERSGELVFVRPAPLPLGDHYAARREIPAAKPDGTVRVAFFGESVATGYLYAPRLTCAGVLAAGLQGVSTDFEVVDLARTNEQLGTLVDTVEASLQLDPDLLVLFAGNNWNLLETPEVSAYRPDPESRRAFGRALQAGGLRGVKERARTRLRDRAESALARVADLAGDRPVVLVVPEANVDGWQSRQPPPWLPGDDTARWHELYRDAVEALDAGRFDEARQLANQLHGLADGLGAIGGTASRFAGLALRGLGRTEDATQAFRDAVDEETYATMALLGAPQATSQAQGILREAATKHGFQVVDLPRILGESGGTEPLFLDYCHLTTEGLRLAMSATAEVVLRALGHPEDVDPGATFDLDIAPETEAAARLGAAVHIAHRMTAITDKSQIVERWIRSAVDISPGVLESLLDLAEHRTNPVPSLPTSAQIRNYESPYCQGLQHGWAWPYLDADLLLAIRRVLADQPDASSHLKTFARLLRRRALGPEPVDLTEPPYLWEPLDQFFPDAMADRPIRVFLRCPWPETSFCVVSAAAAKLHLEVVARLPSIEGAPDPRTGELVVELDDQRVGVADLADGWCHSNLSCSVDSPGLHRLTLRWPRLPAVGDEAMAYVGPRLARGLEADLHPVFGEVHSLRARSLTRPRRGSVPGSSGPS